MYFFNTAQRTRSMFFLLSSYLHDPEDIVFLQVDCCSYCELIKIYPSEIKGHSRILKYISNRRIETHRWILVLQILLYQTLSGLLPSEISKFFPKHCDHLDSGALLLHGNQINIKKHSAHIKGQQANDTEDILGTTTTSTYM